MKIEFGTKALKVFCDDGVTTRVFVDAVGWHHFSSDAP